MEAFEDGLILNCQDFMNSGVMKYNKISAMSNGFKGSVHTVQEDIVALVAAKAKAINPSSSNNKRKGKDTNDDDEGSTQRPPKRKVPTFINHYKSPDGTKYKIGDTQEFDGETFHFCDAPHRNRVKWHTHSPDECRVRKDWLKKNKNKTSDDAEGHVGEAELIPDSSSTSGSSQTSTLTPASNSTEATGLHALLASAMNMVNDNDVLRDYIAEAINAANAE